MMMQKRVTLTSVLSVVFTVMLVASASASLGDWIQQIKAGITGHATSQGVALNVTVGNTAPTIVSVYAISSQSPTESSVTNVYFNFTASDPDGSANLKTTAIANFSFSTGGEPGRYNLTCSQTSTFGSTFANYSCYIQMWYFDSQGVWNVTAVVNDTSNAQGVNSTTSFTFNQLSAFVQGPGSLSWTSLSPGAVNQTSNNDPLILNNTGNKAITDTNVQINATDLQGETDNTKAIYTTNITTSIFNQTAVNYECGLSIPNQSQSMNISGFYTVIANATLPRGNNSLNYWNGTSGQRQIFFCIRLVGNELSSQSYSTSRLGAWTTKIL